jgi:hypothetical protein
VTRQERKELYAKWDKVTLDDLVAMDEETYGRYRIYVAKKRRKVKNAEGETKK